MNIQLYISKNNYFIFILFYLGEKDKKLKDKSVYSQPQHRFLNTRILYIKFILRVMHMT